MVQKKLNKKKLAAALISLFLIIFFIIFSCLLAKKKNSIEYKLETVGYSKQEVEYIKKEFNESEISELLKLEYDENIIGLSKEKYFRFDKLNEYLKFYKQTKNITLSSVITKVNTKTTMDFYDEILDTDTSKNELMAVNKVYKLSEEYVPEDLIKISSAYAYSEKYISNSILQSVMDLIDAANEEGIKLIVSQGYRSYQAQEKAYNSYKLNHGIREADVEVARAGHSDYQTGLALVIEPYKSLSNIEESEEYKWLSDNAHLYGFVRRYPKDKEDITGFKYDPWRLRYVGTEAATFIHSKDIAFEEYYGYKF